MAIAGKVAITLSTENGGAWSADVTYDRLVAVKHNNNLYISRKTVANVEPPNDEFWFLALEGFSGDDIEDIIDGTQQVGNAKTLDGHEAEDFATAEELSKIDGTKDLSTSILEKALTLEKGIYEFVLGGGNYSGNDLPKVAFAYGNATVFVKQKAYALGVVLWGSSVYGGNTFAVNQYNGSTWQGWDTFATTADLANYLPLTGGRVGDGASSVPLTIDGGTSMAFVEFGDVSKNRFGGLGFTGKDIPAFIKADRSSAIPLLHTGNKPTGTYTGNGDATIRKIAIGGIGNMVLLRNNANYDFVLVTGAGYIGKQGTSFVCGTDASWSSSDGNLSMSSTSALLNANGVGYLYYLL